MVRVIDDATRAAVIDLEQLVADYWHDVDGNDARDAPMFFTEDCAFHVGSIKSYQGREGVKAFYDNRFSDRGKRTTRHTFTSLRVTLQAPDRADVSFVVVNYGADGPAPITEFDGPSLVSQVTCVCERDAAGAWRFASLRGDPVFIGKEPYTRQVLVGAG